MNAIHALSLWGGLCLLLAMVLCIATFYRLVNGTQTALHVHYEEVVIGRLLIFFVLAVGCAIVWWYT
jgi:hypothetical protein